MRPFYFFVSVWGERYSDYFLDLCIPSLLSPGNIPSLPPGDHRFLIASPEEDWQRMRAHPSFARLSEHCTPVQLPIPAPGQGVLPTTHMGIGHIMATTMCFENGAYGVSLTPDMVLSDGAVDALARHAAAGKVLVLVAALRFAEEPFFAIMESNGHRVGAPRGGVAPELSLSPRELVAIALRSLHPETAALDYDREIFMNQEVLPAVIRRIGDRGLSVHCLSWAPLLIDYAAVEEHDVSTLSRWTIDGDYIFKNFASTDDDEIHVCLDSDEIMHFSWGPSDTFTRNVFAGLLSWLRPVRTVVNGARVRENLRSPVFDDLKRRLFSRPVRLHSGDIDSAWDKLEKELARIVTRSRPYDALVVKGWSRVVWNYSRLVVLKDFLHGHDYARAIVERKLDRMLPGRTSSR